MRVVVALPVLGLTISNHASFATLDVKTPASESPIADAFYSARDALKRGSAEKAQVLLEARLEVGQQIDKPSDEHIAREAANKIEMNIQVPVHHPLETRNVDRSKVIAFVPSAGTLSRDHRCSKNPVASLSAGAK